MNSISILLDGYKQGYYTAAAVVWKTIDSSKDYNFHFLFP